MDLILRFLIGGAVVSFFAVLGDMMRPKSFAGIFGAAPSVALATLVLTIHSDGPAYAATEARSMLVGACATVVYALVASHLMWTRSTSVTTVSLAALGVWLAVALGLWLVIAASVS